MRRPRGVGLEVCVENDRIRRNTHTEESSNRDLAVRFMRSRVPSDKGPCNMCASRITPDVERTSVVYLRNPSEIFIGGGGAGRA